MFNFKMSLIFVFSLILGGCGGSDVALVRIHSLPTGATVVEKDTGKTLGVTPLALWHTVDSQEQSEGRLNMKVNVYWPDGRKKENESFSLIFGSTPALQAVKTRMKNSPLHVLVAPSAVNVTYKSFPSGATIIEDGTGKNWGVAPVSLLYQLEEKHLKENILRTQKMTAYWPDGRRIEGESLSVDVPDDLPDGDIVSEQTLIAPPFDSEVQRMNATIQMQSNRVNTERTGFYAEAKREYGSALVRYNRALANLNTAKNMRGITRLPGFGSGSKTDNILGLFSKATSHGEVQMRERELEIAWQLLERAKAKLRSAEY